MKHLFRTLYAMIVVLTCVSAPLYATETVTSNGIASVTAPLSTTFVTNRIGDVFVRAQWTPRGGAQYALTVKHLLNPADPQSYDLQCQVNTPASSGEYTCPFSLGSIGYWTVEFTTSKGKTAVTFTVTAETDTGQQAMTIHSICGWETNSLDAEPSFGTPAYTGTVSIESTIIRSGSHSLKVQPASGADGYWEHNGGQNYPFVFYRVYVRITALPATVARNLLGWTAIGVQVRINPSGLLSLYEGSTLLGTSTTALTDTTRWYRIEVKQDDVANVQELRINGVSEATGNVAGAVLYEVLGSRGGNEADTYTAYFDDFQSNDTSYPGEGKDVLLLPISDNARSTLWTGGVGGTTSLFDAVNNTPPIGTASETNLTQIEHAGSAAGTTDHYDANMTTYTTAGLASGDTLNAILPFIIHGEDVSTGTKNLSFEVLSNPAIASSGSFTAGGDVGALGTYPSNWKTTVSAGAGVTTVTLSTSPVMRVVRPETATRVASVCFMGMYVDYTPSTSLASLKLTPSVDTYTGSGVNPTANLESVKLTPAVDSFAGSGANPTATLQSIKITPTVRTFTGSGVNPSVNLGSIKIAPSIDSFTGSGVNPSVTAASPSLSITPSIDTFTGSGQDPTTHLESIKLIPAVDNFTGSGTNPSTTLESVRISPSADNFTGSGVNPSATLESTNVTPATDSFTGSGVDPTVKLESVLIVPTADSYTGSGINPITQLESLRITPSVDTYTGSGVNPTARLESINVAPAADSFTGDGVDPQVELGSLQITPGASTYNGSGVDPTPQLESLQLTTNAAHFSGSGVDPITNLESVSVAPSVDSFTGSGVDPTVITLGGSLLLTPNASSFTGSGIDPTIDVAFASLSILPVAVNFVGNGIDPTVVVADGVPQRRAGDVTDYHFKRGHIIVDLRKNKKKKKKTKEKYEITAEAVANGKIKVAYGISSLLLGRKEEVISSFSSSLHVKSSHLETYNIHVDLNDHLVRSVRENHNIFTIPKMALNEIYRLYGVYFNHMTYREQSKERFKVKSSHAIPISYKTESVTRYVTREKINIDVNSEIQIKEGEDFIISPEVLAAIAVSLEDEA